jgi:hypothetical protein
MKIIRSGNFVVDSVSNLSANPTAVFITKCLDLFISTSLCCSVESRWGHQLSTEAILKRLKAVLVGPADLSEALPYVATPTMAEAEEDRSITLNRGPTHSPRTSTPTSILKVFLQVTGEVHRRLQWGTGAHLRPGLSLLGAVLPLRPMATAARHTDIRRRHQAQITDDLHHRICSKITIMTLIMMVI